jgi:tetratricopeptide (TPR) repeat protein
MKKYRMTALLTAGVIMIAGTAGGCSFGTSSEMKEYRSQGIEQMQKGSYDSAAKTLQKALDAADGKTSDMSEDISYYLALAYYKSGNSDKAIAVYTDLIDSDKEDSYKPYYLRGCVYAKENEITKAAEDFDQAVKRNPKDYELCIGCYEAFKEAGETSRGETYLKKALNIDGTSADDLCEKGYINYLLGDTKTAQKQLAEAVEGDSVQAMLYQGVVYAADGDRAKAKNSFDEYASRSKKDGDSLRKLGAAALNSGLTEAAISYYQDAVDVLGESSDNSKEARKDLIAAYEQNGDFEKAYKLMSKYASDYPEDKDAQNELTFLKTRIKD